VSATFLADFQRDPAKTMRKRLEEVWAQVERQAEQTAKAREHDAYVKAYARRHTPNNPEAA
jgi:hypothetical protein